MLRFWPKILVSTDYAPRRGFHLTSFLNTISSHSREQQIAGLQGPASRPTERQPPLSQSSLRQSPAQDLAPDANDGTYCPPAFGFADTESDPGRGLSALRLFDAFRAPREPATARAGGIAARQLMAKIEKAAGTPQG